jgi:CDP-paratose 2-epimerase
MYLIQTNLMGTANCLELAREHKASVIFLSTSRVYPKALIESLTYVETDTRYRPGETQEVQGVSPLGISEDFPLVGARTLYGASKLASELLVLEYLDMFGVEVVVNRCGTIAGPWQMGKVDQGFLALWVARHLWGESVEYLGYGGKGKQVRDVLHIEDLCALVIAQIEGITSVSGQVFNIGGGEANSVSLMELTGICESIVGRKVKVKRHASTAQTDIRFYVTDASKAQRSLRWRPSRDVSTTVTDVVTWMRGNEPQVRPLFAGEESGHPERTRS